MPRSIARLVHSGALLLAGLTGCTYPNPEFDPSDPAADASSSDALDPSSGALPAPESRITADTGEDSETDDPLSLDTTSGTETDDVDSTGQPGEPPTRLFVNFSGPMIVFGDDDAALDQSELAEVFEGRPLLPYGNGPKRANIMQALHEHWAPFDVEVTDQRPAQGDYGMVVVTPTNPVGDVLGISHRDCDDANPRSVGFVFASINDGVNAQTTATAISHTAGRGYGLEGVTGPDIMNPGITAQSEFVDECMPLTETPMCMHSDACPYGYQNSFTELLERFGPP
ncbi:MAG: hypothetical protein AAGF11_36925 [Myxococcota bacterium]